MQTWYVLSPIKYQPRLWSLHGWDGSIQLAIKQQETLMQSIIPGTKTPVLVSLLLSTYNPVCTIPQVSDLVHRK